MPYLFSIFYIMAVLTSSSCLLQALVEEKENRLMEILGTSMRPGGLMAGKILGFGLVGLTPVAVWAAGIGVIGVAALLLLPTVPGLGLSPWPLLFGVFTLVVAYFLIPGLLAAVGAAVTSTQEAQQFSSPFSLLVVLPLVILPAVFGSPGGDLAVAASLFPPTAPVIMLQRLLLSEVPAYQVALSVALLLLSAAAATWVAGRILRFGMLRYGKRLSQTTREGGERMKFATVVLNELTTHLRRPAFWISTLLVPLILLGFSLFFGSNLNPEGFASGSGPSRVAFVDKSGITAGVLKGMPQKGADGYQRYPSEKKARAAVESGEISGYYVVPQDYPEDGTLRHYSGSFNPFASGGERGWIETLLSASLIRDRGFSYAQRLAQPASGLAVKDLEAGSEAGGSSAAFALGFLFALLPYISIFSSSNFLLRAVVEEKENRLMEILLSSAPPKALLRGKMAGLGVLGLLQISLWVAAGYFVLRGSGGGFLSDLTVSPAGWALALVCFLFGYAMYAALMAAVGSVATTMRESSQLIFVVILPIVLPLVFLSALIQQPGGILAQILSYIPLTAPVVLPVRQVAGGVPAPQLVISLALMALTVLLLQAAATRIFRAHTLLSGSKPSLGAVLRALR